ncbi:VOC family protein [Halalkalibacter akibai]|uniref:Lactoylglutathione lyase and related lyases n=1 Tax=Halalkalibacter akibai (strain ATCC 43226 / DSM 21942 / CIP 109018 / JCM 9157 / 1139) TaxID=1236973 RepID=W4QV85_HALA3|nr:VOC family protein [Halalkalibacter akibai]GAE35528.1 lactoylglutathione lyase and related lyases [Halalkalibacter akibai JCM 9157]
MSIKRIEHVGVMVTDIEKSISFYQNIIGMQLKNTLTHTNGHIKLAFLGFNQKGETELELIQGYNDELPNEGKVHHFAIKVNNLDEEVKRIRELEVPLIDKVITVLPNGARYFFFHGPDGEWIEFFESER